MIKETIVLALASGFIGATVLLILGWAVM